MKTNCADALPAIALAAAAALGGCGPSAASSFSAAGFHYSTETATEWRLPGQLRELSGFTTDSRDRLFAHDDEIAVVHQIDYARGSLLKSFALGDPPLTGDFEGLTMIEGRFALTTSDGDLYIAGEGDDRERVDYELIRTGLGKRCEIEGVEYLPLEGLLYFACKRPRDPALGDRLTLIAWSPETGREVPDRTISIEQDAFADVPGKGPMRASGIAHSPADGSLLITAAGRKALLTVSIDGELTGALRVPDAQSLPQLEAVALTRDGTLLLGSEGDKQAGRMRVYRAIH